MAESPPKDVMSEPDGDAGGEDGADGRRRRGGIVGFARETAIVMALSLLIATVVRIFFVQAFQIPSGSMEDTLYVGDRVMVSKISVTFGDVERGDVVVFKDPGGWLPPAADDSDGGVGEAIEGIFEFVGVLPDDSEGYLIKRVIGVGGDHVVCCDDDGAITVNDEPLDESHYLKPGNTPSLSDFDVEVPEGHLWVMGDHRSNSGDSRYHQTFSEDDVVGKAFARVWPISRWDGVGRPDTFDEIPEP